MNRYSPSSAGFTLIELLVTIAIIALIAALAAPAMGDMMASQRLRATATDLMSSLLMARSEAIKRNAVVTVKPLSGSDWTSGWQVVDDADVQLDVKPVPGARVKLNQSPTTVAYKASGRTDAGTLRFEFADVNASNNAKTRCVKVDTAGLPKLKIGACT